MACLSGHRVANDSPSAANFSLNRTMLRLQFYVVLRFFSQIWDGSKWWQISSRARQENRSQRQYFFENAVFPASSSTMTLR